MQPVSARRLPKVGFANELSDANRDALGQIGQFFTFSKGERIVRFGDNHERLHLVVEGELVASVPSSGASRVIAHIRPGETFGEINLFDPQGATADVIGEEPGTVWRVRWKDLEEFLCHQGADVVRRVLERIARQLSRRLRNLTAHVQGVDFGS